METKHKSKIGQEYIFIKSGNQVRVLSKPDRKGLCEVERIDSMKKMIVQVGALFNLGEICLIER